MPCSVEGRQQMRPRLMPPDRIQGPILASARNKRRAVFDKDLHRP